MSVFVVKDVDFSLQFKSTQPREHGRTWSSSYYVDIPLTTDFGLLDEKFQQQLDTAWKNQRKKMKLSATKEPFTLRFSRYISRIYLTAFGSSLESFMDKHKNTKLGMNLIANFDDGFKITCEMNTSFASSSIMITGGRKRIFEGSVPFDSKMRFKLDQLYAGNFSLEIVDRDAFEFEEFSRAKPMLKRFLEDGKYSDFAIIAQNGVRVPCHKMFLGDQSPVLDRMLQTECKETTENCIKMDVSEKVVKAFLKFLYYSNLDDALGSPNIATELLELAHVYDVKPLEKTMKSLLLKKTDEWLDMDAALNLFLCANGKKGMESLKERALKLIRTRKDELNASAVFQHILEAGPSEPRITDASQA